MAIKDDGFESKGSAVKTASTGIRLAAVAAALLMGAALAPAASAAAPASDSDLVTPMAERGGISYSVHVRNIGWLHDPPGTMGQGLPIEAINFNTHSGVQLCLRAHVQNIGWQKIGPNGDGWQCARSGGPDVTVGTTGQGLQIEALQIKSSTHRIDAFGHQAQTGDLPLIYTKSPTNVIMLGSVSQGRGLEYVELMNRYAW